MLLSSGEGIGIGSGDGSGDGEGDVGNVASRKPVVIEIMELQVCKKRQ